MILYKKEDKGVFMKRLLFLILGLILSLSSCSSKDKDKILSNNKEFVIDKYDGASLRIASGSENKELEEIIKAYAEKNKQNIEIDYMGSLDMIKSLETDGYDAIWPASSMWIGLANSKAKLKYEKTISISPVVFAIKESLAKDLGFVDKEVSTKDLIGAINANKLKFTMTNASRSNSGASAYLGFLTALSNNETLRSEDLDDPELKKNIRDLLKGVRRSSGSSNWLIDLFLEGDYDAMVNYEALIITANKRLEEEGKEPLYVIYLSDGLAISDSPFCYVDRGDKDKEKAFLALQDYLLSDEGQEKIEKTGKRNAFGDVYSDNEEIFNKDWGIDTKKALKVIRFPKADVIKKALEAYQEELKKPALTCYVLDYSSSMQENEGYDRMMESLSQIFIEDEAKKLSLLGNPKDKNIIIPFASDVLGVENASGSYEELAAIYDKLNESYQVDGATAMNEAIAKSLEEIKKVDDIASYTPAVVVLTDGKANGPMAFKELEEKYGESGLDLPIFSITYGSADKDELDKLAQMSRGRVFDGKEDMAKAFYEVKGYN